MEYVLITLVLANVITLGAWWLADRNSVNIVETLLKEQTELQRELTNRPSLPELNELIRQARVHALHEGYQAGFSDGKIVARRAVAKSASQTALASYDKLVK